MARRYNYKHVTNDIIQHMKQKLTELKGESFTVVVGDFNTPLTIMDQTTKQNIS